MESQEVYLFIEKTTYEENFDHLVYADAFDIKYFRTKKE